MNLTELMGHLVVGVMLLIFGFAGWLWKQSIYGEFNDMKGRFDEIENRVLSLEQELIATAQEAKLEAQKEVQEAKSIAAKGVNDIKDLVRREVDIIRSGYVPVGVCNAERDGCQGRLLAKIESLDKGIGEKLDLVIQRQMNVISRIDSHINGHRHDK